jgi:hypothetical protein
MVVLPIADCGSLSDYYVADSRHCLLRIPGSTRFEIGQPVDCGIYFEAEGIIFQSQGFVASRSSVGVRGIEVELPSGSPAHNMIEKLIAGGEGLWPARRQSWRYHAGFEVEYTFRGVTHKGMIEDIGVGGAAIRSDDGPEPAARLTLRLHVPASAPVEVDSEVCWRSQGQEPVFGVRFVFSGDDQRSRVNDLLNRIKTACATNRSVATLSVQ